MIYQRKRPEQSIVDRMLCPAKPLHGIAELLELQSVTTEAQLHEWAHMIWPMYRACTVLFQEYDLAETYEERIELVLAASDNVLVSPDVVTSLSALNSMNEPEFGLDIAA